MSTDEDLGTLLAWGRACRPARVLDLATGEGRTALAFAAIARSVVAYDLTASVLAAARGLIAAGGAGAGCVAGGLTALPFRDGAFGLVACRGAAHHFAEPAAVVREVQRVLCAGGTFLVQDTLGHDDAEANAFMQELHRHRDPAYVKSYRSAEWKAFLRAAGLTVMEQTTVSDVVMWDDWTAVVDAPARVELERFVRDASERARAAFDFRLDDTSVKSFAHRLLLIRAERD